MHGSRRSTDQIGFGPFVDVRAGELRKGSSRLRSAGSVKRGAQGPRRWPWRVGHAQGTQSETPARRHLRRPRTRPERQNGVAGTTKDQHETTRCPTPPNLQNLHPRFKSGRRLHFSSAESRDRAAACVVGDSPLLRRAPNLLPVGENEPLVSHCFAATRQRASLYGAVQRTSSSERALQELGLVPNLLLATERVGR